MRSNTNVIDPTEGREIGAYNGASVVGQTITGEALMVENADEQKRFNAVQ